MELVTVRMSVAFQGDDKVLDKGARDSVECDVHLEQLPLIFVLY